jgi:hypothetical protein
MGITVRGIPEVQRNLAEFPKLLVMGAFNKALSRAAAVFETELRARTPESDYSTSSEEYGHLVDNLMDVIEIDSNGRGGRVSIGFGRKSMVALWVEYGHRMLSHSGKGKGTVQAHPFMRPAFEAAAEAALEAFTLAIQEFLQQDNIGLKLAA